MNLPEKFAARLKERLCDAEKYFACFGDAPYKGVRANTLKISSETFLAGNYVETCGEVPWEKNAFYTREEKPGRSIAFAAGLFYVQEPSAMCAAPLLGAEAGERVLDLCSAPGGKGTQLAAAMGGGGILVLNEKVPSRAAVLSENAERMGVANAVVISADPEALEERFAGYFDKILVDAPCSGEGMFRKEPAALSEWSEENVAMCAARQKKILSSAVKMLRCGGRLVYSTCTFAEEEDEENAAWLASCGSGLSLLHEHKIWPHRERGEGHYAALFEKEGTQEEMSFSGKKQLPFADKKAASLWRSFCREHARAEFAGELMSFGNSLYLVPEGLFPLGGLKVLRAGIRLGEAVGDRFEPAHALALAAPKGAFFNENPLCDEEAAAYLRGEETPAHCQKGWCVATWKGYALGWGKSVGGVMKNKLPKALRRFGC